MVSSPSSSTSDLEWPQHSLQALSHWGDQLHGVLTSMQHNPHAWQQQQQGPIKQQRRWAFQPASSTMQVRSLDVVHDGTPQGHSRWQVRGGSMPLAIARLSSSPLPSSALFSPPAKGEANQAANTAAQVGSQPQAAQPPTAYQQHLQTAPLASMTSPLHSSRLQPPSNSPLPPLSSSTSASHFPPTTASVSTASLAAVPQSANSKAELGRATWTFLHTLAAQFPDKPSRQQQKDARNLVDCLTRIYPCGDCASHFAELVKREPPPVSSGPAFRRWMCRMHNHVNTRLGKPSFNCEYVEARWQPLDCGEDRGCDLAPLGSKHR